MNRRRIAILAIIVAVAAAAAFTRGFGLFGDGSDEKLTLYGNVDIREVDLGFRVSGRIARIAVDEGDKVRSGQLLAALDTSTIESRVAEAEAQIGVARAQLEKLRSGNRPQEIAQARARLAAAEAAAANAERDYRRRQPLVAPGAISRDVWDQTVEERTRAQAQVAEARQALSLVAAGSRSEDVAGARAQLAAAEATRRSVGTDLSDTRIVAAAAGTVVTRAREPGAIVQPGENVLTLAIDRPMRVRAYIAEPDLGRISPGMAVLLSADGNPRTYRGRIGSISPRTEFTPKSVETEDLRTDLVYRLRIIVDDPDDALRQGQPLTIHIPAARPRHED